MDITNYVLLGAVLVGINQLVRLARAKDWWGVVTVVCAVIVGLVFGLLGWEGLDVPTGLALAFGSVGTLTGLQALGSNNSVAPSAPLIED